MGGLSQGPVWRWFMTIAGLLLASRNFTPFQVYVYVAKDFLRMRKMKFAVNRSCLPFSKVALFLMSSMLVATHNVSGQPWDLATDFSLTNNPVTVGGGAQWSWGVIDAADNFAAMDVLNPSQAVIGGNPAWELPCCTNGVPLISNNGPPSLGAAVGGHEPSGIDGIGLAYQWTSPIAGPVHIDASAFRLVQTAHSEANPRAQGYEVRHNNEVIDVVFPNPRLCRGKYDRYTWRRSCQTGLYDNGGSPVLRGLWWCRGRNEAR